MLVEGPELDDIKLSIPCDEMTCFAWSPEASIAVAFFAAEIRGYTVVPDFAAAQQTSKCN